MRSKARNPLFILLLVFLTVGALGFLGYQYGFLGFIYNVAIPQTMSNFSLVVLSVIFGIAAFFSPCAISVLPAYISHYLSAEEAEESSQLSRLLYLGFLGALGIIIVNMVVGAVIGLLGSAAPFEKDPRDDIALVLGIRIAIGAIITVLGIMTMTGKTLRLPFVSSFLDKISFKSSIFYYGIFYNAAAVGCTGPIMLGLMLYALSTWSFSGALTAFVVFSITMGILMIIMTVLIGLFKGTIVKKMIPLLPMIKKIMGAIMIVVGLFLVILTLEGNRIFVDLFFPYLE